MRKVFVLAIVFVLPISGITQEWVARYNGPSNGGDGASAIAVDNSGNVYVTGGSSGDYATVKYNSSGDTVWVRRYNGPADSSDGARAIAIDGSGNVYVTGGSEGSGTRNDYATIKYNPSGDEVWIRRYNGPGNDYYDEASAIAVDDSGNVYVTGKSRGPGTSSDYTTIKYNSSGDTVWVRKYNGPGNADDYASAIAVDGAGNVYVTGASYGLGTYYDYATIKYNSLGVEQWVERYYRNGGAPDDYAEAIAVDGAGNVYVTGTSDWGSGTSYDYTTIKYNPSGDAGWIRRYNGPGNGDDCAGAIAIDGGHVYVTGSSCGSGTDADYATIKYNSSGDAVWVRRYNGPDNDSDGADAITVDGNGNVYVTGTSYGAFTYYDYVTIKYNSSGDTVWVKRYNGPGNDIDDANAIAVDGSYVYVTGVSYGLGTYTDYATIKYSATGVEERNERLEIKDWRLQIYPNPSFGNVLIKYGLQEKANISLRLYDISGRLVKSIYSGVQEKGYHKVNVGAYHDTPTGIYFIRLDANDYKATRKLTIIR